jgi:hypothetical protein
VAVALVAFDATGVAGRVAKQNGNAGSAKAGIAIVMQDVVNDLDAGVALRVDAARAIIIKQRVFDAGVVVQVADVNSESRVVVNRQVSEGDAVAVGVLRDDDTLSGTCNREMVECDIVGTTLDFERICAGDGTTAIEHRCARTTDVTGTFDPDASVIGVNHNIAEQIVGARIDVDHIARVQVVGREQGSDAGHRGTGRLAAVNIVADGGGKNVPCERRVVHVIVVARVANHERHVGDVARRDAGTRRDANSILTFR